MLRDASKPVLWHEISSTGSDQERHEPLHVQARTEAVQIRVQRVSTAVQKWAAPRRRITCVDVDALSTSAHNSWNLEKKALPAPAAESFSVFRVTSTP